MNSFNKVIFLCSEFPFPPRSGSAIRESGICEMLAQKHHLDLIYFSPEKIDEQSLQSLPKNINIHHVQREKKPLLKKIFYPLRPYVANGYSKNVEKKIAELYNPNSVIWISRLANAYYIKAAQNFGYKVILDEQNVESDLFFSSIRQSKKWFDLPLAWQLKIYEQKFCTDADKVVVTSKDDANRIKALVPNAAPIMIPNCISAKTISDDSLSSQKKLLFVGTLDYQPNIIGLNWFMDLVWPKLKERGFSFTIAGRRASDSLKEYCKSNRIQLIENAASLDKIYKEHSICIVPLLTGGGTRLKILEAFALGKAVVSTSIGAEGIDCTQNEIRIADGAEDFLNQIIDLDQNETLKEQISKNAQLLVKEKYTWESNSSLIQETATYSSF